MPIVSKVKMFMLCLILLFPGSLFPENPSARITNVYVQYDPYNPHCVYYDTEESTKEVLVCSDLAVYFIRQLSEDKKWAIVVMNSSNPDQAKGTSEVALLYYVPTRQLVSPDLLEMEVTWYILRFENDSLVIASEPAAYRNIGLKQLEQDVLSETDNQ